MSRILDAHEGIAVDSDPENNRLALQRVRSKAQSSAESTAGLVEDSVSSYRTVAKPSRFEHERIKGSRFIADVQPIASAEAGLEFVAEVWREFDDASHVCWAWRLGAKGQQFRVADDGEPGGSAGLPIMRRIEGHELSDTLVCVTRWFGGTKLGVGGLVRAYGGAAGMALDRATVIEVHEQVRLAIDFSYNESRAVEGVLRNNGLAILNSAFDAQVRHVFDVALDDAERVTAELRDATAGRARVVEIKADR